MPNQNEMKSKKKKKKKKKNRKQKWCDLNVNDLFQKQINIKEEETQFILGIKILNINNCALENRF